MFEAQSVLYFNKTFDIEIKQNKGPLTSAFDITKLTSAHQVPRSWRLIQELKKSVLDYHTVLS